MGHVALHDADEVGRVMVVLAPGAHDPYIIPRQMSTLKSFPLSGPQSRCDVENVANNPVRSRASIPHPRFVSFHDLTALLHARNTFREGNPFFRTHS